MNTNDNRLKAHKLIDHIFQDLLPAHGMAQRPEQIQLSHRMLDAMQDGRIALCDAGTGIGKTYAYLAAATAASAFPTGQIARPIIISTSSTAKAGAIGFTTSLAKEMAPYNVNVNVIPVPTTDTPLLRATLSQEMIQREIDVTPMKRIATTEDIADTVLFLVSDAARYITGQIIAPNGGRRMLV